MSRKFHEHRNGASIIYGHSPQDLAQESLEYSWDWIKVRFHEELLFKETEECLPCED